METGIYAVVSHYILDLELIFPVFWVIFKINPIIETTSFMADLIHHRFSDIYTWDLEFHTCFSNKLENCSTYWSDEMPGTHSYISISFRH